MLRDPILYGTHEFYVVTSPALWAGGSDITVGLAVCYFHIFIRWYCSYLLYTVLGNENCFAHVAQIALHNLRHYPRNFDERDRNGWNWANASIHQKKILIKKTRTVTRPRFREAPRTVRGPELRGMHHNYDRQPTYVNQIADVFNIYCVVSCIVLSQIADLIFKHYCFLHDWDLSRRTNTCIILSA